MALSLLTVHAHPDDEASKGAGLCRRYADEGVHTVLVTCTDGAEGDILNPALDTDEVRSDLIAVRLRELDAAVDVIGFSKVHLLGYRDSGMPESEANSRPDCFHQASMEEAVGKLVAIIRAEKPQVIITYGDDQAGYPHPDHLKVHDITVPAFDLAADPDAYPDAGEPWQPLKLYYSVWSRARMVKTHEKFLELGLESPFSDEWFERPHQDHRITTRVSVDPMVSREALLCHATQIDPTSPFWFGLPPDVQAEIHGTDDYIRARSLVEVPDGVETDLFAGVRETVTA